MTGTLQSLLGPLVELGAILLVVLLWIGRGGKTRARIRHLDWVLDAGDSLQRTLRLYKSHTMPSNIEVFMVVTPVRRLLRGVYGSNFRAAWALLFLAARSAIGSLVPAAYWRWRYRNIPDFAVDATEEELAEAEDCIRE